MIQPIRMHGKTRGQDSFLSNAKRVLARVPRNLNQLLLFGMMYVSFFIKLACLLSIGYVYSLFSLRHGKPELGIIFHVSSFSGACRVFICWYFRQFLIQVGKILLNALIYPGIKMSLQKNSIVAIFHTAVICLFVWHNCLLVLFYSGVCPKCFPRSIPAYYESSHQGVSRRNRAEACWCCWESSSSYILHFLDIVWKYIQVHHIWSDNQNESP